MSGLGSEGREDFQQEQKVIAKPCWDGDTGCGAQVAAFAQAFAQWKCSDLCAALHRGAWRRVGGCMAQIARQTCSEGMATPGGTRLA